MTAACSITCGSWGQGLAAWDRLFAMLPYAAGAIGLIIAVWIVSEVRG